MNARFIHGSIMRHVISMATTGAVALIVVFFVDFLDVFFIAQLGDSAITAGLGFSANISFFVRSAGLALSIATGVLVSRSIGQGQIQQARRLATHCVILAFVFIGFLSASVYFYRHELLLYLGASGKALFHAENYLGIVLISSNFLTVGFCGGQVLRALGEGKKSMQVSCISAVFHGILDPIFIFVFHGGLLGAGWASVCAQIFLSTLAWSLLAKRFQMVYFGKISLFFQDIMPILRIASPTLLTNMAGPICTAFAGKQMATFGDEAMSGFIMVMRFFPLTASVILALSGAVAPIIGQNAGAKLYGRVRLTLYHALWFNWAVIGLISLLLYFSRDVFIPLLNLSGLAQDLFYFYCSGISLFLGFDGMLFFVIAGLNNLARPFLATLANLGRVIFGAIPFILLGKYYLGAKGVLLGFLAENLIISSVVFYFILFLVKQYEHKNV